jgi:hypothetical protein
VVIRDEAGQMLTACTCPYHLDHANDCKHIIATLLAWVVARESFKPTPEWCRPLAAKTRDDAGDLAGCTRRTQIIGNTVCRGTGAPKFMTRPGVAAQHGGCRCRSRVGFHLVRWCCIPGRHPRDGLRRRHTARIILDGRAGEMYDLDTHCYQAPIYTGPAPQLNSTAASAITTHPSTSQYPLLLAPLPYEWSYRFDRRFWPRARWHLAAGPRVYPPTTGTCSPGAAPPSSPWPFGRSSRASCSARPRSWNCSA